MKKTNVTEHNWLETSPFLFPERLFLSDVSPASLCNLCHHFSFTSLTTSHPPSPYFSIFPCGPQSPSFFLTSAHLHKPPSCCILYFLLPFLALSSPHPSVIFIFTGVMLVNVPLEEITGKGRQRCLDSASPVCSQGTGKAPSAVLTPQGWEASDGMTRGGCVGVEEDQDGMWISNSANGLGLFRCKRGRVAGKWKHSLLSHV